MIVFSEREKEVLQTLVEVWDDADGPLPGHLSYADVFDLLDKLNLQPPRSVIAKISALDPRSAAKLTTRYGS